MKKLILTTLCIAAVGSAAFAQGTLNFVNSSATLVSLIDSTGANIGGTPTGVPGTFRYEVFRAPAGTLTDVGFTSGGIIGTNLTTLGRFAGGSGVAIAGAPLGGTGAVLVRGWSANLGATYAQALVNYEANLGGYLGSSSIAPNFLFGGDGGAGPVPPSALFGGSAGIQTGFSLVYAPVPEPSSMVLAGLGAASLLMFRRKK